MKKVFFSLVIITILSFGIGAVSGNYIVASNCYEETNLHGESDTATTNEETGGSVNLVLNAFTSLFTAENVSACSNDVYMGGKWATSYVPIKIDQIKDATIRANMQNAITH